MKKSELVKIIKEAVITKRALNEEKGNSLDQLMTNLGDAILADDIEAMKEAGRALLAKAKATGSALVKKGVDKATKYYGDKPEDN
jgi:hypothetical protein